MAEHVSGPASRTQTIILVVLVLLVAFLVFRIIQLSNTTQELAQQLSTQSAQIAAIQGDLAYITPIAENANMYAHSHSLGW